MKNGFGNIINSRSLFMLPIASTSVATQGGRIAAWAVAIGVAVSSTLLLKAQVRSSVRS